MAAPRRRDAIPRRPGRAAARCAHARARRPRNGPGTGGLRPAVRPFTAAALRQSVRSTCAPEPDCNETPKAVNDRDQLAEYLAGSADAVAYCVVDIDGWPRAQRLVRALAHDHPLPPFPPRPAPAPAAVASEQRLAGPVSGDNARRCRYAGHGSREPAAPFAVETIERPWRDVRPPPPSAGVRHCAGLPCPGVPRATGAFLRPVADPRARGCVTRRCRRAIGRAARGCPRCPGRGWPRTTAAWPRPPPARVPHACARACASPGPGPACRPS